MGKLYGYARCSTSDKQDVQRQVRELKAKGVDGKNIFTEYESGIKLNRVELHRLLSMVKQGDSIISTEVSRITRSTKQLCEILEFAKTKKLKLVMGTFMVDCTKALDPMTEGMLKMMGVFAELERNMISERVKSGLANARSKGKLIGRPRLKYEKLPEKVIKFYDDFSSRRICKTDYARVCNISRPTLDKYLMIIDGDLSKKTLDKLDAQNPGQVKKGEYNMKEIIDMYEVAAEINGVIFYLGPIFEEGDGDKRIVFTSDENYHIDTDEDIQQACKRIYENCYSSES